MYEQFAPHGEGGRTNSPENATTEAVLATLTAGCGRFESDMSPFGKEDIGSAFGLSGVYNGLWKSRVCTRQELPWMKFHGPEVTLMAPGVAMVESCRNLFETQFSKT